MKTRCEMTPIKIDGKNYLLVTGGEGPSVNTPRQLNAQYNNPTSKKFVLMSVTITIYQLVSIYHTISYKVNY